MVERGREGLVSRNHMKDHLKDIGRQCARVTIINRYYQSVNPCFVKEWEQINGAFRLHASVNQRHY